MVEEGGSPSPAEGALFLLPRFPPPALQPLSPSFTPAATSTRAGPLPPFHLTPPPPTSCRPLYYFLLPSYWTPLPPSPPAGPSTTSCCPPTGSPASAPATPSRASTRAHGRTCRSWWTTTSRRKSPRSGRCSTTAQVGGRGGAAGDMGGRGCMGMGRGLEAEEWSANVMV